MHEPKQETAAKTSFHHLQPTAEQQPEALASQETLSAQQNPLARTINRVGNTPSASIHATMLNRSAASQNGAFLRQLQRQYGNSYVQRVLALSRKADDEAEAVPEVEEAIQRNRGNGQSLDGKVQAQMESAFGVDFGGVRVHTDAEADTLNRALDARAFTTGQDIFFRQGEYNPNSSSGRELLAHELTHVVQQTGGIQTKLTIGQPNDSYEQEADRVARAVIVQEQQSVENKTEEISVQRLVGEDTKLQGQFVTPLGAGGGYGGLLDRDRRSAMESIPIPTIPTADPNLHTIKVWINAFIPMASVGLGSVGLFSGDGRGFSNSIHASSRTHQEIEFEAATLRKTINFKHIGTSHLLNPVTGSVIASRTASTSTLTNGSVVPTAGGEVVVDFQADSAIPLIPGSPAINLEIAFHIDPARRTCRLTGAHDGFPAYEAYVTANGGAGVPVYTYDPRTTGQTPNALFPPMDVTLTSSPVSF